MQELNQNQNGEQLDMFKKRIVSQLKAISDGQYQFTDEIKQFLSFASNEMLNGKKCIILQGNVGSGKSILMRVLADTVSNPRKIGGTRYTTAVAITDAFREKGFDGIKRFLSNNYVIDEVGLEPSPTKIPYENTYVNVIEYVFLKRYDSYIDTGGLVRTHMVTNLGDAELVAFYGERFFSRLELLRAKKSVIGASSTYTDFRKDGKAFHYKSFDWEAYEQKQKFKEMGDINTLIKESIREAIELHKAGKDIFDAGAIKWNYLVNSGDPVALEILAKNKPKEQSESIDDILSGKRTDTAKCFVEWLNIKSN
jgi:hypothetical protein